MKLEMKDAGIFQNLNNIKFNLNLVANIFNKETMESVIRALHNIILSINNWVEEDGQI
jgi:hypothetical protein